MRNVDNKIEIWKKKLLDLGKRNRLINYRDTKRSNINIIEPEFSQLFKDIVEDEKTLTFSFPIEEFFDIDDLEDDKITSIPGILL